MKQNTRAISCFLVASLSYLCILQHFPSVNADDSDEALILEEHKSLRSQVSRAEVQSCRGCALNRLPEVKAFIYEDVGKYTNIEFKPIPGANPDLVLFTASNQELDRIDLSRKSRKECNDLLLYWGFSLNKPQTLDSEDADTFKAEL